jgi:phage-related protein
MSGKPTVTLTLAGDEKKLTEAFDRVGTASKSMGDKVGSASKDMADSSSKFDVVGESADNAEGKFMGFHDVLDGVKGAFETLSDPSASFTDKLIGLGQAGADVAGGMASFLIPALGGLWTKLTATAAAQWVLTTAQGAWNVVAGAGAVVMGLLNAAFIASPIGWIVLLIGGLVAAFIILWNKSAGFRQFFIDMWEGIKSTVGSVIEWIKGAWNGMLAFFSGLVTGIGNIFAGIGNAIKGAFKSAVNWVIDMLNHVIDFFNKIVYGINLINPFNDIPNIPHIPRMHTGGVVPGMPGQEVLMMMQGGEHVNTSSQGASGGWHITGDADGALASFLMSLERNGILSWRGA